MKKNQNSKFKNQKYKGFSLLELIIALALILVTLLLFGGALGTLPLTKHARDQNLAYHLAAKKLAELRNTDFSSLPGSGSFSDPGLLELENVGAELLVQDYDGNSEIKQVSVTINWEESGTARNIILETLMSEGGLNR